MNDTLNISHRRKQASKVISSAMKWAAGAALVPVPLVDVAALAAVQVRMVVKLSNLYHGNSNDELARSVVSVLVGTLAPVQLAQMVTSSGIKAIPVVGTVIGVVTMPAFASAATYAIGEIFVRHFERGGTLSTFDAAAAKHDLEAEFVNAQATA